MDSWHYFESGSETLREIGKNLPSAQVLAVM